MTAIVITKWHEENPNDWVAIQFLPISKLSKRPFLIDRDESLVALHKRLEGRKDVIYGRAWGMGIGKEYPIGE